MEYPVRDVRFYRAQERAFAPGIVRDWPKVFRMPRKCPHGRLVAVSLADVVHELRGLGYRIEEPPSADAVDPSAASTGKGSTRV